jgi:hypothetical protein
MYIIKEKNYMEYILHGKEKVTYTIICMTSYYLLIYQVKNVVGYPNSNTLP